MHIWKEGLKTNHNEKHIHENVRLIFFTLNDKGGNHYLRYYLAVIYA